MTGLVYAAIAVDAQGTVVDHRSVLFTPSNVLAALSGRRAEADLRVYVFGLDGPAAMDKILAEGRIDVSVKSMKDLRGMFTEAIGRTDSRTSLDDLMDCAEQRIRELENQQ